ncbi:MarR family winged helix-turn-helix transcriptional regulator [Amycolatopsis sp. CA-230715]|uniref:MarR family winged helix-turn-helix transcriptional regulator n=1 Tax=Amycolatopsis sp. CA-230715 TaxID=2745196 RepID=UPI001C018D74|nr:MarR family transcriptional regulator [Amycolatopsis sp. CA-230715]
MRDLRVANLLGATALAVTDLVAELPGAATGLSVRRSAALVTLSASPDISVSELGRRVGLTQSATVRLVDTLEGDGLVARSRDRFNPKSVTVAVTATGEAMAGQVLRERTVGLADVVDSLDPVDQRILGPLLSKLLFRLYQQRGRAQHMCRLCDRNACNTAAEVCPVGEAERRSQDLAAHGDPA